MNLYIHESRPDRSSSRRVFAVITVLATVLAALALAGAAAPAFAQVMGDDACPKFAVDHAGFASCDGDRAVKADSIVATVSPHEAHALKRKRQVLFIDVRPRADVASGGTAAGVDYVVPHRLPDIAAPLSQTVANGGFVNHVAALANVYGGDRTLPIVLICAEGTWSATAARELRAAGFTRLATVAGGIGGNGIDAGWVKSGLPLVATDASQLNGWFE